MVRALFRLILIVIVVVALGAFFYGYQWGRPDSGEPVQAPVGTSGRPDVDPSRARQVGAEIGEKVAVGANEAQRTLSDASLTTKIKAKMALDDTVDAKAIDVDTDGTTVTLNGTVRSEAERRRALQLARETQGVSSVVDRLRVRP